MGLMVVSLILGLVKNIVLKVNVEDEKVGFLEFLVGF